MEAVRARQSRECKFKCRHCGHAVRVGDAVLVQAMNDAPAHRYLFVIHARCVKVVLGRIEPGPIDAAARDFEALRSRMIATGKAFPDD